jgi:hypothetical protein
LRDLRCRNLELSRLVLNAGFNHLTTNTNMRSSNQQNLGFNLIFTIFKPEIHDRFIRLFMAFLSWLMWMV